MFDVWFPNLGIKIEKLNRVAFSIFGLEIYWYGVLIVIGILIALMFCQREAKKAGQNPEDYSECLIYATILSVVFARLYYVAFAWDKFKDNLVEIFLIRNGGIAIYGAIIGAAIAILIYTKIKKINFFKFTDVAVFGLLIGQIIGRWGNFINREAFGGYTNSLFAMRYPKSQVMGTVTDDILNNIVKANGVEYIQVHPTFLYESIWNLAIFIILNLYKKNKKFDGELTALYFIFYGIGRFWIESLRADSLMLGSTNIQISSLLSIVLVAAFSIFILLKRKFNNTKGKWN